MLFYSHQLRPGDSGSIAYLPWNNKRLPFAMYIGQVATESDEQDIYAAILLAQALRDIEIDYSHHVKDLKPFDIGSVLSTTCRPPMETPDIG